MPFNKKTRSAKQVVWQNINICFMGQFGKLVAIADARSVLRWCQSTVRYCSITELAPLLDEDEYELGIMPNNSEHVPVGQ